MKIRLVAVTIALSLAGCAAQPLHSKTSSPLPQTSEKSASQASAPAVRRVTLPYTFSRRGVEIRVNSIEFSGNQVLVSVSLQETRGDAAELLVSTLMQVLTSSGQALAYTQFSRADKIQKDPTLHVAASEQFSITLVFQAAAGSSETVSRSLELRFPTGKYWDSNVAE